MLRMVVFPEPLGPMSAWISPRRTSMSTPSTAVRPPKCFGKPLALSNPPFDSAPLETVAGGGSIAGAPVETAAATCFPASYPIATTPAAAR